MAERPFDIVVTGELNPDLILSGGAVPEFGQVEKMVDQATLTIGSSSAIFACGAARLGLKVAFIGKVGRDLFGEFMLSALEERGIDTRGVRVDPAIQTGLSVILAQGNDRACLTYSGSIAALKLDEIDPELVGSARHLHLASYFIQTALRPDVPALFALAHRRGLTVSLDTNYDPAGSWDGGLSDVLARTDIFLPNEVEARAISGQADLSSTLDWLAGRLPTVAVKLGRRGGAARRGAQEAWAEVVPVEVVDTVGAGDSFDAGFIYACLAGWDLARSLRLASVCGSLSTRQAGGTDAQATLAEALAFC
jgi:sugar/nucleoside kinase (ribokinase family)